MLISRRALIVPVLLFVCFSVPISSSSIVIAKPIYTYTDDSGVLTFTTEWHSIPEKYRSDIPLRESEPAAKPPAPTEIPASPPPVSAQSTPPSATVRTVKAGGEYRMGDHDTKTDAVRLAVEAAKKDALEQVATYLESVTEVRNLDVTRDDIRSYTAGIVKVVDQAITTRVENGTVVIRADLTAEIDPHEVAQAITALRENEGAKNELAALRAETDQLQQQLDAANQALAAAASPDEVQQLSQQREDMLNELQANALVSQAWTSVVYASPGFSSYPWIGVQGINGLLVQAQRFSPRHRHLSFARQMATALPAQTPALQSGLLPPPSRQSLLMPLVPHRHTHRDTPLLNSQGLSAKVGDVVVLPSLRSIPSVLQHSMPSPSQPQQYQLHPNHFWRPSPPNIHSSSPVPQPSPLVSPRQSGGYRHSGGGQFRSSGGHRGR